MPVNALPEITLRSAGAGVPMRFWLAPRASSMLVQLRSRVANANVPAASVPMKLPTILLLRAFALVIAIPRPLKIASPRTTLSGEVMKNM